MRSPNSSQNVRASDCLIWRLGYPVSARGLAARAQIAAAGSRFRHEAGSNKAGPDPRIGTAALSVLVRSSTAHALADNDGRQLGVRLRDPGRAHGRRNQFWGGLRI
jgi:hypothetical protein